MPTYTQQPLGRMFSRCFSQQSQMKWCKQILQKVLYLLRALITRVTDIQTDRQTEMRSRQCSVYYLKS